MEPTREELTALAARLKRTEEERDYARAQNKPLAAAAESTILRFQKAAEEARLAKADAEAWKRKCEWADKRLAEAVAQRASERILPSKSHRLNLGDRVWMALHGNGTCESRLPDRDGYLVRWDGGGTPAKVSCLLEETAGLCLSRVSKPPVAPPVLTAAAAAASGAPLFGLEATKPGLSAARRHNATCPRCKGEAFVGLFSFECMRAGGCVPVAEREPGLLDVFWDLQRTGETRWCVSGLSGRYATRDLAVAAWRALQKP